MKTHQRILILTSEFPPQPGGIGNHAYNLAEQLSLNNFHIEVIADQRSKSGHEEVLFDDLLKFRIFRVSLTNFRLFMYLKRLKFLFNSIKKADLVIASGKFSLWSVAFCSFFYDKKFIAIVHGTEVNFKNKFLKGSIAASLKRFSSIIAVSNYTKSLLAHLDLPKVHVIPNGYNSEDWNVETIHDKNLDALHLITVGNVTERKGQLNVIKHLPTLIKTYPNVHYHCVGIPTQQEAFLRTARQLQVEKYLSFHGRLTLKNLQELLLKSTVNVMLSSPTASGDVEGFGIAIIEANALGLPAIGSKNCGIEDAIDNYCTGVLVASDNALEFLEAIKTILDRYPQYQRNAIDWAEKHRWEAIVKRYIEVINL